VIDFHFFSLIDSEILEQNSRSCYQNT